MALLIEAGQMTASDNVPTYPDLLLASEEAATDAIPTPPAKSDIGRFLPFSGGDQACDADH